MTDSKINQGNMTTAKLEPKDIRKTFFRWWLTTELSNSYDRLQGLAFCNALSRALRKIYAKDDAAFKESLARNMEFYNSEGITGSIIHGITLSMEEEKASGLPLAGEVITSIKTALMGPIAGIGDTLIHGTLKPIFLGIACTFALEGNAIGAFIPFLIPILCYGIGLACMNFGYRLGRTSVMKLMKSGIVQHIITGAGILGLTMMGALGSSYVKISTPLQWTLNNTNPIVLQDILDSILKGILPLSAIMLIYRYFTKKGANYNKVIFGILLFSMIAAFLGILK
ncbi:MAG: PTS system mannose/fructose/sorbose family transporter subunit IID [Bulleidia sp.]